MKAILKHSVSIFKSSSRYKKGPHFQNLVTIDDKAKLSYCNFQSTFDIFISRSDYIVYLPNTYKPDNNLTLSILMNTCSRYGLSKMLV